jgi:hypothetical protein
MPAMKVIDFCHPKIDISKRSSSMIPAVAQSLAELLARGTPLITTEQIDFDHPGTQQHTIPRLNLYCYDLRENIHIHDSNQFLERRVEPHSTYSNRSDRTLLWFDVSFLVSAWDRTALGEQRLLSEALRLLLCHQSLQEKFLVPELQGYGNLNLTVTIAQHENTTRLWSALRVPLRPALYITVTVPCQLQGVPYSAFHFTELQRHDS